MLVYPAWVLAEMRAICARHRVLFIADEVMTGWGRTGTRVACEQAGVIPDILCLSKGMTGSSIPPAFKLFAELIFSRPLSTRLARLFSPSLTEELSFGIEEGIIVN